MNDYSKWDKIRDSDEESEADAKSKLHVSEDLDAERLRDDQELVARWLRKQVSILNKAEGEKSGPDRAPELTELVQARKVSKEDIKVLSMLIVISHFEEGMTNLDRHPQMLDLVRHHRWLEEDPGCLELLCRVHSQAMRKGAPGGSTGSDSIPETAEDKRIRNMCFSGINTLAAPKKAKCAGGLLELVTLICTPASEEARELRRKWQKKDFAKDAIFESLFPDLKGFADNDKQDGSWKELWVIVGILFVLACVILFVVLGPASQIFSRPPSPMPTTTVAPTPAPVQPPPSGHEPAEL